MYKLAFKLLVVTAVLTGACLFLGGGHVAADALPNNCGAATDTGLPARAYDSSGHVIWGNDSDGEGSGVMASMIMRARDQSGNPLNPQFTIHSELPGGGDQAQIYHWPIGSGGSVSNSDAWPQHGDFQFGTTMHNGPGNPVQCNGWVVLGPGTAGHVGNGWVLNCHSEGPLARFWVSHIDNPGGQPGRWQMLNSSGAVIDNNVNDGSSPHVHFNVQNGTNMRFTFVWIPDTPNPGTPNTGSECSVLDVQDGGDATINGKHFTSDAIRTTVRVYDDSGQVMVHGSGGQGDPVILNNAHPPPGAGDWNPPTGTGHWTYTPRNPTVHVIVHRQYWHNTGVKNASGNWIWAWDNYEDDSRTHGNCYGAVCWIDAYGVAGNVPNGPRNAAVENSQFQVTVHMQNTGVLTLNSPTVNGVGLVGGILNQGGWSYTSPPITVTAPSGVQTANISFTMNDGTFGNLGNCSVGVPIYTFFTLEPHATLDYATAENPGPMTYSTYINNRSSAAVSAPTQSEFYIQPYGGGRSYPAGPVNTAGPYNPGGPNYTINPATYTPTNLNAGDQYCSEIDFTGGYNQGYVGPGGAVAPTGLTTPGAQKCVTIVNEPYHKAYNSVSAGGKFSSSGSCSGGGLLAGWNDNQGGLDRGAGSNLSALALIKITGFASAQKANQTGSPTGLTFANTNPGDISSSSESPSLGGNYDPTGSHCLTTASPPSGTTYQAGPYVQSGMTNFSGSRSLFVNGDVRITGNITYANNTAISAAPSFVIHATGNIYVDPGVTELDGEYISDHKIYTCDNATTGGNGFGAASPSNAPPNNMFFACRNQLLVRGSFVADQVNFGRTFGSLRDEQPVSGIADVNMNLNGNQYIPGTCYQPGASPNPENSCFTPNNSVTDWENYNVSYVYYGIPLRSNYTLTIHYDNFPNGPWPPPAWLYSYIITVYVDGVPRVTSAVSAGGTAATFNLGALSGNHVITISGYNNYWIGYGGNPYAYDPNFEIRSLNLHSTGVPGGVPAVPRCSNAGGRSANSPTSTCASEIFQYSPSLYISKPNILPPNNGATPYDAITSLPPVL